jgi:curved DNA-binding protein CbpA
MMSKTELDPYAVLGVPHTATEADIRAAYLALMAKYHPDRHQGNPLEDLAAAKVAEINSAYDILSNPKRRAAYDSGRLGWPRPANAPFSTAPGGARKRSIWMIVVGLLLLLPLLLRFGSFAVRMLVRLFRLGIEGMTAARGTPVALIVVLVTVVIVLLLFHRRRSR